MHVEELREYALQKGNVDEGFPFGEQTLVFKVQKKIFLLVPLQVADLTFNAKCDPDRAIALREQYPANVYPGYHMNKKHWNTVIVSGKITKELVKQMIDESYSLVAPKQKK